MMPLLFLNVGLALALAFAARHEHRARNFRDARLLGIVAMGAAGLSALVGWQG